MRKVFQLVILLGFGSMGQFLLSNTPWNLVKSLDNPKEIMNDKPRYGEIKLDLREEILIKESEDRPQYMFRRIWDLAVDSNGFVYVLDDERIIKFDNQGNYIATIGKKGQGPGEFMQPHKLFLDQKGNLYVNDQGAFILEYSQEGSFKKLVRLSFSIPAFPVELRNFYVDEQGYIYAFHREYSESGIHKNLLKVDRQGQILKKIADFPEMSVKLTPRKGGRIVGGIIHPYSSSCFFCPVGNSFLCFGENMDYKLFLVDLAGNIQMVFSKRERAHPISSEEKKKLGEGKELPHHRPFFKGLLSDEKGRIYVIRTKSILDKSQIEDIDIFSRDGIYLYRTSLKHTPQVIKDGCIYVVSEDERGLREIKKLKIRNYLDIKEN